jgi:hypothetical protein
LTEHFDIISTLLPTRQLKKIPLLMRIDGEHCPDEKSKSQHGDKLEGEKGERGLKRSRNSSYTDMRSRPGLGSLNRDHHQSGFSHDCGKEKTSDAPSPHPQSNSYPRKAHILN